MNWFRKKDRRRPENAAQRVMIDELKRQAEEGARIALEHQQAETARRAEKVSARLAYLNKQARVLRRQ